MNLTEDYISIPERLLIELRDNQLAIAIYFLIARLYLVLQKPVPLSRQDIRKLDPSLKIGATKRALDRLTEAGWLVESAGYKSSYMPVWGKRRGTDTPYVWDISAPHRLGCPKHIWTSAIRVDRALLDLFMGKFMPHARNPYIESYFTRPLLSLADIGTYILIAAALPAETTKELERWGLVRDGQAQSIPDDDIVLALASQRTSLLDGFQLTAAGWRRLGWFDSRPSQSTQQAGAEAVPLIFVPKERIGSLIPTLIGESIGCSTLEEEGDTASECAQTALRADSANIPGITSDPREPRDTTPNPLHMRDQSGGGSIFLGQRKSAGRPPSKAEDRQAQEEPGGGGERAPRTRHNETSDQNEPTLPDTEAVRLLWAVGGRNRERLAALSATPPERVEEVIAAAQARPTVIDKAGWAIAALSEGWDIAPPRETEDREAPIKASDYIGGQYGDLFRLGSDTSDLDEHPDSPAFVQPGGQAKALGAASNLMRPNTGATAEGQPSVVQQRPPVGTRDTRPRSAAELTHEMQSHLLMQCDRYYHNLIRRLQIQIADDTTVIHCISLADRMAVLDALMGALRYLSGELGLPPTIRVTDRPPSEPSAEDSLLGGDVSPQPELPFASPRATARDGRSAACRKEE